MDEKRLTKHIEHYRKWVAEKPDEYAKDHQEREERKSYFQAWSKERLLAITPEELYVYLRRLWALRIWGNKQYVVDKIISNNALQTLRRELAELIWGSAAQGNGVKPSFLVFFKSPRETLVDCFRMVRSRGLLSNLVRDVPFELVEPTD